MVKEKYPVSLKWWKTVRFTVIKQRLTLMNARGRVQCFAEGEMSVIFREGDVRGASERILKEAGEDTRIKRKI